MEDVTKYLQPKQKKFNWYSMGLMVRCSNHNLSTDILPMSLNERQVREALDLGFEFFSPVHHKLLNT